MENSSVVCRNREYRGWAIETTRHFLGRYRGGMIEPKRKEWKLEANFADFEPTVRDADGRAEVAYEVGYGIRKPFGNGKP